MAGGTAQNLPVLVQERLIVRGHRHGIGRLVLIGKGQVVPDAVTLLKNRLHLSQSRLKQRPVLRRNGHRQVAASVGVAHILLRLHQMLGQGGPHLLRITMELQHALGFGAIV